MAAPTPERRVAGRYELQAPLGRGGMGVVWRAHDTVLGREVALKEVVFPATLPAAERGAARARLLREARAAARLNHPGAVTLYDVVQDQGHPVIVMELVGAPTLAELVRRSGPLPPARVAELGAQLAEALEAAHRAGIVHRDVKPGNVMVPADGPAKLADFGVASLQGDPRLTTTGLVLGSPAYMAPEQASGEPSGPEADLWALGATLYYAVEGEPPFDRGGSIPTLAAVVNDDPRPARRAGPLAPVLLALLDKDPAARPTGPELRRRLAAAAGDEVTSPATLPAQAPPAPPPPRPAAAAPIDLSGARRRPRRLPGVLVGVVVLALLLGGLAALLRAGADRGDRGDRGGATATTRAAGGQGQGPGSGQAAAGWRSFTSRAGAWTAAAPPGWTVNLRGGTAEVAEPGGGRRAFTVRSRDPANPLPQASRDYRDYARRHLPGFQQLRFDERASYAGQRAVVFEYLTVQDGRQVHVSHVNFVGRRWGYNVMFTAPAGQWDASQALARQFERGFRTLG